MSNIEDTVLKVVKEINEGTTEACEAHVKDLVRSIFKVQARIKADKQYVEDIKKELKNLKLPENITLEL